MMGHFPVKIKIYLYLSIYLKLCNYFSATPVVGVSLSACNDLYHLLLTKSHTSLSLMQCCKVNNNNNNNNQRKVVSSSPRTSNHLETSGQPTTMVIHAYQTNPPNSLSLCRVLLIELTYLITFCHPASPKLPPLWLLPVNCLSIATITCTVEEVASLLQKENCSHEISYITGTDSKDPTWGHHDTRVLDILASFC